MTRESYSFSFLFSFPLFFSFGCTHGMWKFPGQGSNQHHSSNLSHSSDNTGSLTHCVTRELQRKVFFFFFFFFFGHLMGSDLSCSCGSCAGLGTESVSQHSRDATDPIAPQFQGRSILFLFFSIFFFKGCKCSIWRFSGWGSNQSYSCWPTPQSQQHQIGAMTATYRATWDF